MTVLKDLIIPGADIKIYTGLQLSSGPSYIPIFTGNIDEISNSMSRDRESLELRCRDNTKRLRLEQEFARVYKSQARVWSNCNNSAELAKFATQAGWRGKWGIKWQALNASTPDRWCWTQNGWIIQDTWLRSKIAWNGWAAMQDDNRAGLIWRSDERSENCYVFMYDHGDARLNLYKRLPSNTSNWGFGTPLAYSSPLTWTVRTWYSLLVVNVANVIWAYYSTDNVNFNLAFTYTDTAPLTSGRCGLVAYNKCFGVSPTGSTYFDDYLARDFGVDFSMDDIVERVAGQAGVMDFRKEKLFEDQFSGTTFYWTGTGGNGYWVVNSGRLVGRGTHGAWGFVHNNVALNSYVMDFEMKIPDNGKAGVIYCAGWGDKTSNKCFYLFEVDLSGYVAHSIYRDGAFTTLSRIPTNWISIPANKWLPYRFSYYNGLASLWCNESLVASFVDETLTSGYVGFASYSPNYESEFRNVRIAKLGVPIGLWQINVGETRFDNINRLLSGAMATHFFDGDGKLVLGTLSPSGNRADVFHSDQQPLSFKGKLVDSGYAKSDLDWFTSMRVDGQACTATVRDETGIRTRGFRFKYQKSDTATSEDDCARIAADLVTLSQMRLVQHRFSFQPDFRIERRDRIHIENDRDGVDQDYIVDGVSYSYNRPNLSMTLDLLETED